MSLNLSVIVFQGFTCDEGKELLAKWTKKSVSELPQEANKILDITCGWPIALNIIGKESTVWMEGEREREIKLEYE